MKWLLIFSLGIGFLVYAGLNRGEPVNAVIAHQRRPDLTAIFTKGNYTQYADQFGTVARAAFDASGKRIGTQIGTYSPGPPNGMVVEMSYLEPDAKHPLGQVFDGAGNPVPLHIGPGQGEDAIPRQREECAKGRMVDHEIDLRPILRRLRQVVHIGVFPRPTRD
jgi:hypothetical protein